MKIDITTSGVTPPNQITGLDHLGVQAPCINCISSDKIWHIVKKWVTDRSSLSYYLRALFEKVLT
jgi:hypothetical protein